MLIPSSSAEGRLNTAFNTCAEGTAVTLHLQERLGMHKGGIKHIKNRRGVFTLSGRAVSRKVGENP